MRIKNITIATTKRICMKPPKVKEVTIPKSHNTRSITAIVTSIYLMFVGTLARPLGNRGQLNIFIWAPGIFPWGSLMEDASALSRLQGLKNASKARSAFQNGTSRPGEPLAQASQEPSPDACRKQSRPKASRRQRHPRRRSRYPKLRRGWDGGY